MNKRIKISLISIISIFSLSSCSSRFYQNSSLPIQNNININNHTNISSSTELIAKSKDAYGLMTDFTGYVYIWDSKDGSGDNADIGESKFFFKKDRQERVEITKSSDSQKLGSLLVYKGSDKVEILLAKAIPLLGKHFTLKVTDKRIATSRGLAFNQMDMYAMLSRVSGDKVKTTLIGEGNINGKETYIVEAIGSFKDIDNEITKEIVNFDKETLLPVGDEAFIGKSTKVLDIKIQDLKLNVGLNDNIFVIPKEFLAAGK